MLAYNLFKGSVYLQHMTKPILSEANMSYQNGRPNAKNEGLKSLLTWQQPVNDIRNQYHVVTIEDAIFVKSNFQYPAATALPEYRLMQTEML